MSRATMLVPLIALFWAGNAAAADANACRDLFRLTDVHYAIEPGISVPRDGRPARPLPRARGHQPRHPVRGDAARELERAPHVRGGRRGPRAPSATPRACSPGASPRRPPTRATNSPRATPSWKQAGGAARLRLPGRAPRDGGVQARHRRVLRPRRRPLPTSRAAPTVAAPRCWKRRASRRTTTGSSPGRRRSGSRNSSRGWSPSVASRRRIPWTAPRCRSSTTRRATPATPWTGSTTASSTIRGPARWTSTALVCEEGQSDGCLTPGQADTARFIYADVNDAEGNLLYPGVPPGAEAAGDWGGWILPNEVLAGGGGRHDRR